MTILLLLVAKKERGRVLESPRNLGNLKGLENLDEIKNKKIEPMFYKLNTFIKY